MQYVGKLNISRFERILWYLICIASLAYSHYLINSSLKHYMANPTVVTIEKDFRNWENPFPAATGCFADKIDPDKARQYILKQWGLNQTDEKFEHLMEFVEVVANLTYSTFHTLEKFKNDIELCNVDWLSIITQVHPALEGALVTFQTKVKTEFEFVITELGLCFTLNSKFSKLLSPGLSINNSVPIFSSFPSENLKCHYLNGLCYARYDSDPELPVYYHIHSYLEVIHTTSTPPILVRKSEEYEINFKLAETYSLEDLRYLSPQQRNCRFDDEPLTNNLPAYSTGLCSMECRHRLALDLCGCKPFFYNFLPGKVCNMEGLLCLSRYSHFFNQSTGAIGCNCPQPCNLMVYLKQIPKITEWDNQAFFDQRITFRWGLVQPTTKYHRKIIFGFQELIVSFGGILSLFVGISAISIVESVYLIGEEMYYIIFVKAKADTIHTQQK